MTNGVPTPFFADMVASQHFLTGLWTVDEITGVITNARTNKPIRGKMDKKGYLIIGSTWYGGRTIGILYHRAVMIGLNHGIIPREGLQVNHINGNKSDNRPCNLELCTAAENCANPNAPNIRPGENHPQSRFSNAEVKAIRTEWDSTRSLPNYDRPSERDFAKRFGVSHQAIHCIVQRITYTDNPAEQEPKGVIA